MKKFAFTIIATLLVCANAIANTDFLDHTMRKLHSSKTVNLSEAFEGKTLLIVNTASNCGFTPQFKSLQSLYDKYKEKDFVILGFPSDDFFQEEDDEKETANICYINYGVTFPMFATSAVRGSDVNPVFKHLAKESMSPKWNFYKYLVSADRKSVEAFSSRVEPDSEKLISAIEKQLKK